MVSWYACFFSIKFWQYFFMNAFATYLYAMFFQQYDKAGHGVTSTWIRVATCPIAAVLYDLLGFRVVHTMLMLLNISIGIVGLTTSLEEQETFGDTIQTVYRLSAAVQTGLFVIYLSSVPRTFGIKFGCVALSFVLLSRVSITIIANIAQDISLNQGMIASLVLSSFALIIGMFFRPTLDIERLIQKQLVTFQDFGFNDLPMNYSKATSLHSINSLFTKDESGHESDNQFNLNQG